jgi:hypothetical protein
MQRPDAGLPILLSPSDLEKIGLVAMQEAQAKHLMWMALTGLCGLRSVEWHKMQDKPFEQILHKLTVGASQLNEPRLQKLLSDVDAARSIAREGRNKIIHGHWVVDKDDGYPILADMKNNRHFRQSDIDDAVEKTAALSLKAFDTFKEFVAVGQRGGLPFCEVAANLEDT